MVKKLSIVYIVPSRYDDDGYVQRWIKGVVPSNSLAVLKSLTSAMITSQPLPNIEISLESYDDNVQRIPFEKLAARNNDPETRVVVGIVGVQSNQFPRASDIALRFRNLGVDVMIGGFHVTGVLALFEEPSPELQHLINHGVSLIAGEAETPGVMENVFNDAVQGTLKPIYRFPKAPDLSQSPPPQADPGYIDHFGAKWATIDSSRGCPYGCTFCTVINIQGRKMRCRSSEAVLATVRSNYDKGVTNFFFTDDNFARSSHWETIFDGLAEMADEGKPVSFMMQIDTQASKIRNFVDKAKRAGCRMVFIGMESVNPENIAAAGKTQNHVDQYREMVRCWQEIGIIVHVGYIIGFPNDTLESVRRDVVFLRDHVGVDLASFFMMTPLPGSVDHLEMVRRGDPIDPDLNKYDSFHETFPHPKMKPGEWKAAAQLAYSEFYTKEHCTNILRRLPKEHYWLMFWNLIWYRYSGVLSGTHPMMTGFFRQKDRLDRRPGMPTENIFRFGWRWLRDFVLDSGSYIKLFFEFQEIWFLTRNYIPGKEPETEVLAKQEVMELPPIALSRRFIRLRHWSPLAQLKLRWNSLQQRVAECNWSGRYDDAVQEIRNTLSATAHRLRSISGTLASTMNPHEKRKARDLEMVAGEIENCLTELDKNPADPSLLYKTDQFVREKLLARYEELSCGCVRLRRRANLWRTNALDNLKRRRFIRCAVVLMRRPWLVIIELYLSSRFSIAAFRKEI
ncbi:MAG: radical SAM protein [Planctomycetaceae bacterium]|jgi:radical SAM superfamily enzyme YgiQ (UPF0313 family)|nr:radical SAM protein [Planctomycetaceae bacterium]